MKLKRLISILTAIALIPVFSVFAADDNVKQNGIDFDLAYMESYVSDGAKLSDKMFYQSNAVREFKTTGINQYVEYKIDIPEEGNYMITLTANISSQWYVMIDGKKLGGVFYGKSKWKEYRIGTISVPGRCTKSVRIASNESGVKMLYASHINLTKTSVYYYDATMLNTSAIISDETKSVKIFGMQDYYQAITYRPDASLTATSSNTVAGRYLEFTADVPLSGNYEMFLGTKGTTSSGLFSLTVNGEEMADAIDLYSTTLDNYTSVANVRLKKGTNTFRFICEGKNSDSKGFMCTITGIGFGLKEEVKEVKPSKEALILESLGIADTNQKSGSEIITRADLAKLLCRLTNVSVMSGNSYFSDVASNNKYYDYICTVVSLGYMNENQYLFYPQNAAALYDVIYAVSNVLGYQKAVDAKGTNWFAAANGLLKNTQIKDSNALTFDEAYKIIYNSLNIALSETLYSKMGNEIKEEIRSGNETILTYYLSLYKGEGIIQSVENTSLESVSGTDAQSVIINGNEYLTGNTDINKYLGYRVEFYYDSENDNTIRYFECKNNNVTTVLAENITGFSGNTLQYYNPDKNKNLFENMSTGVCMIFNGKAYLSFSDSDVLIDDGWITMIDNNNDGNIDVLDVVSYKNYFVISVFKDTSTINTKTSSINLDPDSSGIENVYYIKNGLNAEISDILAGDIISVAESLPVSGKKFITVYISSERVDGKITAIDEDRIYIDDEEYRLDSILSQGKIPAAGSYCVVYLDINGNASYISTSDIPVNYITGYLVKMAEKSDISGSIILKIFDENGVMGLYNAAKKIKINETSVSGNKVNSDWGEIYNTAEGKAIPQIILFKLNSRDEISAIITPQENDNALLRYAKDKEYDQKEVKYLYRQSPKYLVAQISSTYTGGFFLDDSTKSFIIPENIENDDGYYITGKEFYQSDAIYSLKAYNVNRKKAPEFIVVNDNTGIHDKDAFGIVSKIVSTNSNNDDAYRITILSGNNELILDTDTDSSDLMNVAALLKRGDIIRFRKHANKPQIVRLSKITSLNSASFDYAKISPSAAYAYGFSRILDVYDGVCVVNTPDSEAESIDSTALLMQSAKNIAVFSNGEVRRGSIADIQPGRDVYLRLSYGAVLDMYIIER